MPMKRLLFSILLIAGPAATCAPEAAAEEPQKSLLIVTTDRIKARSARLQDFVSEKEKRGFKVTVATEAQFGGAGVKGQDKAVIIRNWLKTVYRDYSFLLLIGDPHPKYGDVPMMKVWPRHTFPPGQCFYFDIDCRSLETDYTYANLEGDWDLNGNGRYGEHQLDDGPGGIDFLPQIYAGRIPVYFDEIAPVDRILSNAISYMNQDPAETGYRSRMLLPAAFIYFKGQHGTPVNIDGADEAEWFIWHYLKDRAGFSYTTLFEQEGIVKSHKSDLPLSEENIVSEWRRGYGMVFWFAHGLWDRTARMIWSNDGNGDGLAQESEVSSPDMLVTGDAARIGGSSPAFTVAFSCEVGSAETPSNMVASLLAEGGSVGMVASSSLTSGSLTDYSDPSNPMDTTEFGADTAAALMYDTLMNGGYPSAAFYNAKASLGSSNSSGTYAGRMMMNYFGDPTLRLTDTSSDIIKETDGGAAGADGGSGTPDAGADGGLGEAGAGCSCSTVLP
jgi:hypothetical protein